MAAAREFVARESISDRARPEIGLDYELRQLDAPQHVRALAVAAESENAWAYVRTHPETGARYLTITSPGGAWGDWRERLALAGFDISQHAGRQTFDAYWPASAFPGVQGAQPPAQLDTTGKFSGRFQDSKGIPEGVGPENHWPDGQTATPNPADQCAPYPGRDGVSDLHRPFLPQKRSHASFRKGVARELRRQGLAEYRRLAENIENCGRNSFITNCRDCGASPARIVPITGCDTRVCPFCARQAAERNAEIADLAVGMAEEQSARDAEIEEARLEKALAARKLKRDETEHAIRTLERRIVARIDELLATVKRVQSEGAEGRAHEHDNEMLVHARSLARELLDDLEAPACPAPQPLASRSLEQLIHLTRFGALARFEPRSPNETRELAHKRWCLEKHREAIRKLQAAYDQVKQHRNWTWKWLTFTLTWDPYNWGSYNPAAMRARVSEVFTAIGNAWSALPFHKITGMLTSCEMSDLGNVHVHVLYRGPFIAWEWFNKQAYGDQWSKDDPRRVGTVMVGEVVDRAKELSSEPTTKRAALRREHRRDDAGRHADGVRQALRETIKYSFKAATVLRAEWMAGEAQSVADPRLAARWIVATRRMHLRRNYGMMRDAIVKAREQRLAKFEEQDSPERVVSCGECGCDLPKVGIEHWDMRFTDDMARLVVARARKQALETVARMHANGSDEIVRETAFIGLLPEIARAESARQWKRLLRPQRRKSEFGPTETHEQETIEPWDGG